MIFLIIFFSTFAVSQELEFDKNCYREKVKGHGHYHGNNYLEETLKQFEQGAPECVSCNTRPINGPDYNIVLQNLEEVSRPLLPMKECLYYSMTRAADTEYKMPRSHRRSSVKYAYCPEKDFNRERPNFSTEVYRKPCLTERYLDFVTKSFLESAKCMGVSPKEIFPIINHESRFQINVGNPWGVYGAGQVTGEAAAEINMDWNQLVKSEHKITPNRDGYRLDSIEGVFPGEDCQWVRKVMKSPMDVYRCYKCSDDKESYGPVTCSTVPERSTPGVLKCSNPKASVVTVYSARTCTRVNVPENPTRSFVYAIQLYKMYKKRAKRIFDIVNMKVSEKDEVNIFEDLYLYMYNGGPYHVETALKTYLDLQPKGKEITFDSFHHSFSEYLRLYYKISSTSNKAEQERLKNDPYETQKRNEVADYAEKVRKESEYIEGLVGGGRSCDTF